MPDEVVEAKQREIERVRHLLLYDMSGSREDAFTCMLRQTIRMLAALPSRRDGAHNEPAPLKRPDRRQHGRLSVHGKISMHSALGVPCDHNCIGSSDPGRSCVVAVRSEILFICRSVRERTRPPRTGNWPRSALFFTPWSGIGWVDYAAAHACADTIEYCRGDGVRLNLHGNTE